MAFGLLRLTGGVVQGVLAGVRSSGSCSGTTYRSAARRIRAAGPVRSGRSASSASRSRRRPTALHDRDVPGAAAGMPSLAQLTTARAPAAGEISRTRSRWPCALLRLLRDVGVCAARRRRPIQLRAAAPASRARTARPARRHSCRRADSGRPSRSILRAPFQRGAGTTASNRPGGRSSRRSDAHWVFLGAARDRSRMAMPSDWWHHRVVYVGAQRWWDNPRDFSGRSSARWTPCSRSEWRASASRSFRWSGRDRRDHLRARCPRARRSRGAARTRDAPLRYARAARAAMDRGDLERRLATEGAARRNSLRLLLRAGLRQALVLLRLHVALLRLQLGVSRRGLADRPATSRHVERHPRPVSLLTRRHVRAGRDRRVRSRCASACSRRRIDVTAEREDTVDSSAAPPAGRSPAPPRAPRLQARRSRPERPGLARLGCDLAILRIVIRCRDAFESVRCWAPWYSIAVQRDVDPWTRHPR